MRIFKLRLLHSLTALKRFTVVSVSSIILVSKARDLVWLFRQHSRLDLLECAGTSEPTPERHKEPFNNFSLFWLYWNYGKFRIQNKIYRLLTRNLLRYILEQLWTAFSIAVTCPKTSIDRAVVTWDILNILNRTMRHPRLP